MKIILGILLCVILAAWIVYFVRNSKRGEDALNTSRIGDGLKQLEANKLKYAVMTETLLAETPDEALLEAVLSNLWAKMKLDLSDALSVLENLSPGRNYIFTIYAITGGVRQAGFEKLKACADSAMLPVCAEGLDAIGTPRSAEILKRAIAGEAAETAETADAQNREYLDAFDAEEGKVRMISFIRSHAEEFCDIEAN